MVSKKIEFLLDALRMHQNSSIEISVLANASGYEANTLKTYLSKNMLVPFGMRGKADRVVIGDVASLTSARLAHMLSQRRNRYAWEHIGASELVSDLIERSQSNAALALEIINRPNMSNRIDAFVLMLTTAWEQLLKAHLEKADAGSIFTGETSVGGRAKTISITQVLERRFPKRKDPVRKNIEIIKDLRDAAAHLLVPSTLGAVTRYFQSSLNNYREEFTTITGEVPFRFDGTGLLTLGIPYRSPSIEALQVLHGEPQSHEIRALLDEIESDIRREADDQYAISFKHELRLDKKNAGTTAIRLTNDPNERAAIVVKVPRDPKSTHPHSSGEVARILSTTTGKAWNTNHVAVVAEFLGVKRNDNEHHYAWGTSRSPTRAYSPLFIDFVFERLQSDSDLVSTAYAARRHHKK